VCISVSIGSKRVAGWNVVEGQFFWVKAARFWHERAMETNKPKNLSKPTLGGIEHFTPVDYWRLIMRRRWIIIITTLTIALAAAVVAFFLPNEYRTTTVILVDPRKVPDSYVLSTVTSGVSDRLATLGQQVLSTSRLKQIIEEMGLYRQLRTKKSEEQIVELMRKSVEVEVVAATTGDRGLGAFNISYTGRDPFLSARVTNRLASLFIEENVKAREEQVVGTSEFLDRELEDAKKDLAAKEEKIGDIKKRYASELPESQAMHLQTLSSLQIELRSEMEAASRAQQQKGFLQSMLTETTPVVNLDRVGQFSSELLALQAQLVQAQTQLDDLRKHYAQNHPDFIKKNLEVADLEKRVAQIRKTDDPAKRQVLATPQRQRNPVVESQIAGLDEEIQKRNERQTEIKNQISYHQSKLERIPVLDQQIASVTRDYEVARDHFRILLDRKFSADMSSNLETRQKGERFVILDAAQPPVTPTRPNRLLIDLLALVVGLGAGLAAAFVVEILDVTVKTERDIKVLLRVPIFGEIPFLLTSPERQRRRHQTILAASGSAVLAAVYAVLVVLSSR